MGIGKRIKYFRNLRGMTQQALGQIVGFPEESAGVRIAQYESESRTPKDKLINEIAKTLDVSPAAICVPDIDEIGLVMNILFAIEDTYGYRAPTAKEDSKLSFLGQSFSIDKASELFIYLEMWKLQNEKLEQNKITKEEYDSWRYNFSF